MRFYNFHTRDPMIVRTLCYIVLRVITKEEEKEEEEQEEKTCIVVYVYCTSSHYPIVTAVQRAPECTMPLQNRGLRLGTFGNADRRG